MSACVRCTCGETACESELCDCDARPCPVDHAAEEQRSARGDFEAWLKKWDVGHAPRTYELLDALLKEHAHELAEKQREFVRQQARDPFHYGSAHWAVTAVDEAAKLIDPGVLNGGS